MKRKHGIKAAIGLVVLSLLLLFSNLTALAADPTWVTKASMSTARNDLQTQVIGDKLYALGGSNGSALSSVESYNPSTDTWTTLASMSSARSVFQTEVINGEIYAIGGGNNTGRLSSMEKYNPTTNTWTTLASMESPRTSFQTAVFDGKIYAFGGLGPAGTPLSSAEVYNPALNTWTPLASMSIERYKSQAAVIGGKIYVIGGQSSNSYLSSAEVYDPVTNSWLSLASMSAERIDFKTAVISGKIFTIGGWSTAGNLSSVEVYDPAAGTWTLKGSMNTGRSAFEIAVLDSRIFVVGGFTSNGYSSLSEMYNQSTDTWSTIASLQVSRGHHNVETIGGTIYAIGGFGSSNIDLSSLEAYTPVIAPSAPTDLTATPGDAQVALNWGAVTDATSYNVYRATTSGGPYTQIMSGVTGTTYTDTGLTNGTTYFYVVTAVNAAGVESAYSNEASATPTAAAGNYNATLKVTMVTGEIKEYNVTSTVAESFISWFYSKASSCPVFVFERTTDLGAYTSRTEYLAYDKISSFEILKY
jgi:hypothetical protein